MNAGHDYERTKRQAQANADRSGVSWALFMFAGIWWVERWFTTGVDGAERVYPSTETIKQEAP